MNDPRYIFSWQIHPEIKVGDKVRVIASVALLETIGITYNIHEYDPVMTVTEIEPDAFWGENDYVGAVTATFDFPLSHWRDFLEIVKSATTASLKLGWMRRDNDIPEEFNTSLYPNVYKRRSDGTQWYIASSAGSIDRVNPIIELVTTTIKVVEHDLGFGVTVPLTTHHEAVLNIPFNEFREQFEIVPHTQSSLKFSWQIHRQLVNGLNADEDLRNSIITGTTDKYPYGIIGFEISLEQLEQLVRENFINLKDAQNDSPTAGEFLEFMRHYPEVRAHGYAQPLLDSDFYNVYRVTIEGLIYRGPVSNELEEAFDEFSTADEYRNEPNLLRCWYD